jgi:hypothetical protein
VVEVAVAYAGVMDTVEQVCDAFFFAAEIPTTAVETISVFVDQVITGLDEAVMVGVWRCKGGGANTEEDGATIELGWKRERDRGGEGVNVAGEERRDEDEFEVVVVVVVAVVVVVVAVLVVGSDNSASAGMSKPKEKGNSLLLLVLVLVLAYELSLVELSKSMFEFMVPSRKMMGDVANIDGEGVGIWEKSGERPLQVGSLSVMLSVEVATAFVSCESSKKGEDADGVG